MDEEYEAALEVLRTLDAAEVIITTGELALDTGILVHAFSKLRDREWRDLPVVPRKHMEIPE